MIIMNLLTVKEDAKVTNENLEDLISNEVEEQLENLDERDYDDWLEELDGMGKIGALEYCASQVLKCVDETAYRCGFTDYQESMRDSVEEDVRYELESLIDDSD